MIILLAIALGVVCLSVVFGCNTVSLETNLKHKLKGLLPSELFKSEDDRGVAHNIVMNLGEALQNKRDLAAYEKLKAVNAQAVSYRIKNLQAPIELQTEPVHKPSLKIVK
ncbi:hypothetical protein [Pseudoalteromonas sp. 68 DY56-GL68]|uniref:hypothetical protein n=1 Tax=Pseudoalteromonas sp. 68 DY56-GL68 TaxID=2974919 RepID=UPI00352A69F1